MKEDKNIDIDYLHPNGKPRPKRTTEDDAKFDEHELEQSAKREKNALQDVDGHHICSKECQKHHEVKI